LNVAGKPIIAHILDSIAAQGIRDVTIVIGYMGELIKDYVTKNYSLNLSFVQQPEPLGLGHSIWCARESIGSEPVFIILGDTIFDVDVARVIASKQNMLGVKEVDDPRRFGVVEMSSGYISKLVEKPENPTSNLAIVGLYHITDSALLRECLCHVVDNNVRTRKEYQLTDALQLMIERGTRFSTFNVDGWYDCGKPDTMLDTNRFLLEKQSNSGTRDGSVIIPPVFISETAQVERCVIGPFATVAAGACVVDSHVRNSIISDGAIVTRSMLEGSIIGNNAVVRGNFSRLNVGDSSEINNNQ
jgi:glucose-1-phosphate thymidylyltransferase